MECQCVDKQCPEHKGSQCTALADTTVYRVDMADPYGTFMCEACATDAEASGVFTTEVDEEE